MEAGVCVEGLYLLADLVIGLVLASIRNEVAGSADRLCSPVPFSPLLKTSNLLGAVLNLFLLLWFA